MSNRSQRLAILSAWPPPFGGVSVHTRRLAALLAREGIEYHVYNAVSPSQTDRVTSIHRRRHSWLLRYLIHAPDETVYIMSPRLSMWLAGAWLSAVRGKRVLIRIRNPRLGRWARGSWRQRLAAIALRRVTGVVCVSREIADLVRGLGVAENNIHCFPGFLPPVKQEIAPESISPPVREFVSAHQPLLVANGKVSQFKGEDLYGIDMLTALAGRLRGDYPRLGIVVSLSDNDPRAMSYLTKQAAIAQQVGASGALFFSTDPGPLFPLLQIADLFLRPTNIDGDANSVREALYCGKPVVASDAAERPAGVTLFRSRDLDEFEGRVREILAGNRIFDSIETEASAVNQRAERYIALIKNLVSQQTQRSDSPK